MKSLSLSALFVVFLFTVAPAHAQFSVSISVDENCNGLFSNTSGFSTAVPCEQVIDPGPGGLAAAVTYDLLNPPGLVGGDLEMLDSDNSLSDVIRFNSTETFNSDTGTLVFYSAANEGGSLADIGFPTSNYDTIVTVTEVNGGFSYTPTAGQPGFVAGAGGPVTYVIASDEGQTPEPASAALVLIGLGLVAGGKRLRRRA